MKIFCIQSSQTPSIQAVLHTISIPGKTLLTLALHTVNGKDQQRWENISQTRFNPKERLKWSNGFARYINNDVEVASMRVAHTHLYEYSQSKDVIEPFSDVCCAVLCCAVC